MSWIGLDIGGTRLKGGLLDDRGRVVARDVEPARPGQAVRELEAQLDRLIGRLAKAAGQASLRGIGAAITGAVDPRVGCVYLPGKIRGLDRHRTVPYLQRRWRVPVLADNDGRLACYGEWQAGGGRGADNLLVLTLGTGIGSGVVMDGRLLYDRDFQRGTQCGHFVIERGGPKCLTGPRGTGESVASITALVQAVRDHLARGLPTSIGRPVGEVGFPDIVAALRRRDPVVREVFDGWFERFATVVLNAYYAYTPDLILLAGGPTKAAGLFLPRLERWLNATAFRVPGARRIPVRIARLGQDAGWMGAALRAREEFAARQPDANGRDRREAAR